MPYNGSGSFSTVYSWQTDKINGIKVRADRMDGQDSDFATGLSTCITKDGQQIVTANIPFANFRLTGVGAATARTDAMRVTHMQDQDLTYYTTGGAADAYTLTPVPAVASYTAGQTWIVKWHAANLTTTPAITVSGVSSKTIVYSDGTAVAIGGLPLGGVDTLTYEATAGTFFLRRQPLRALGLADGGVKTANFTAAANTRYRMKGMANAITAILPGASGTKGDVILLAPYGSFGGLACGTINGVAQTLQIDQQSLPITYTSVGWV